MKEILMQIGLDVFQYTAKKHGQTLAVLLLQRLQKRDGNLGQAGEDAAATTGTNGFPVWEEAAEESHLKQAVVVTNSGEEI